MAQTMRSSEMRRPCVTSTPPGSTATAALARCSTTPRSTSSRPKRARTTGGCCGSSAGWSVTSANRGAAAAQRLQQLPLHRQQHFDARRAAADDADRAHAALGSVGLDPRPRGEKAGDRLDGKRVRQCARYPGIGRRTDVDRDEVERLAPSRSERHRLRVHVERLDAVDDESRAGPPRERRERDVRLLVRVVSRRRGPAACPSRAWRDRARPASARRSDRAAAQTGAALRRGCGRRRRAAGVVVARSCRAPPRRGGACAALAKDGRRAPCAAARGARRDPAAPWARAAPTRSRRAHGPAIPPLLTADSPQCRPLDGGAGGSAGASPLRQSYTTRAQWRRDGTPAFPEREFVARQPVPRPDAAARNRGCRCRRIAARGTAQYPSRPLLQHS